MGQHDKHLPDRKHMNKGVGGDLKGTSVKDLQRMARGQGTGTKNDAKNAKDNRSGT